MSFAWDGRKLATITELHAHIATLPVPAWPRGVVVHHTWNPTVRSWKGAQTVAAMGRYYERDVSWTDGAGQKRKGWSSGPNLFVAPDGFYIGTPLTEPGTHAGAYNSHWWGMEVVGNYDQVGWPNELRGRIYAAILLLFDWKGIRHATKDTIRGHRECGSPKTCPGTAISMDQVRSDVDALLAQRGTYAFPRYRIQSAEGWVPVRIAPDPRAPRALDGKAQLPTNTVVEIDSFTNGFGHLARTNVMRDLGFISEQHLVLLP